MSMYQNKDNSSGEIEVTSVNDRVDAIQRMREGTFTSVLVCLAGMRKSIILNLVKRDIRFTELKYGAGVYRIMSETSIS